MSSDAFPAPPFPPSDSGMLKLIVQEAMEGYQNGEVGLEGAIMHAAVHGWFEGHVQGEDSCPGCQFRGNIARGADRDESVRLLRRRYQGQTDN